MPENRPGRVYYATNETGGTLQHGQVVAIDNRVGVAVKQKAVGWEEGLEAQDVIAEGEEFIILVKGVVLVDAVGTPAKGEAIYINAENELTENEKTGETANTPFGRTYEVAGERGCPTGKMRVDLDAKDSI